MKLMAHSPRPRKTAMKTSLMNPVFLAAFLLFGCAKESPPPDAKLAVLQARLDAAQTQADMNMISAEISQHQDRKLARLEELIRHDLHDEELEAKLDKAAALWREYREAQAEFAYNLYHDGSMRGLIYNSAFAKLTEDRIQDLQYLRPDPKYSEDGQGGWVE